MFMLAAPAASEGAGGAGGAPKTPPSVQSTSSNAASCKTRRRLSDLKSATSQTSSSEKVVVSHVHILPVPAPSVKNNPGCIERRGSAARLRAAPTTGEW